MNDIFFLPYLRRGLSRHLSTTDPGAGAIGPAEITMSLTVAGEPVAQPVGLLAPQRVASLDPGEILRRYPAPGARDVESNYFPLVEFRAPDLPWRFTPASPGANGRLRPWLALVVVETDAEDVEYIAAAGAHGVLRVQPEGLARLPAHDELWGWAHVQSSQPADRVSASIASSPETLLSRIICPRRLAPDCTYRAALVNAFRAGTGDDEKSEPAWSKAATVPADLLVFDTWTFTTSKKAADFESLCELLKPASKAGALGVRLIDVSNSGLKVQWSRSSMTIDFVGALADPGLISAEPPPGNAAFAQAVEPILNDVLSRAKDKPDESGYKPLRDDPVVGLPFYGSWSSRVRSVPKSGWARETNVRTDRRIAAGLGARIVRRNQEEFVAAAWDQLGSIREASDELNRGRLSAEIGRSWQARLARVDDGDRIGLAAPLLTFVQVGGKPARETIAQSRAPEVLLDRVWLRRTPRARGASASSSFLRASRPGAPVPALRAFNYQKVRRPKVIHTIEPELASDVASNALFTASAISHMNRTQLPKTLGGSALAQYMNRTSPRTAAPAGASNAVQPSAASADADAGEVARAVAELNPLLSVRASLVARIPALKSLLPAGELPAAFGLNPQFLDALFWDLLKLDKDVLVPGLRDFPNNRVRLLAVNAGFVGALLIGANHEMSREFLWREYPASLSGTFFQRFFDYEDENTVDVLPMDGWLPASNISANVLNAASTTVILIRGDLIRHYPDVNVFLAPQDPQGEPLYNGSVPPTFEGRLSADVLVLGFPLAPKVVLGQSGGSQYFVVLEERMTAPRFGLDIERKGVLTGWDELAWTDFEPSISHIGTGAIPKLGTPAFPGTGASGGQVVWGRNAAHLAAAVHQRPFRRLYPASELVKL